MFKKTLEFKPLKLNSNDIVDFREDPYEELDIIPSPPFEEDKIERLVIPKSKIRKALDGVKVPSNLFSEFIVPEKTELDTSTLYFNPDDVNPFTTKNNSIKSRNSQLFENLYQIALKKRNNLSSSLLNSPFYLGNDLPKNPSSESEENNQNVSSYKISSSGNTSKVINYFVNKGFSKEAASGIAANLYAESKFNPSILGDNKTSGGIALWHGPRLMALKLYAKSKNKNWNDLDLQLDYIWYELNTSYKNLLNKLQTAKTSEDAANMWGHDYERFKGYENYNHFRYRERRNYAKQFFNTIN